MKVAIIAPSESLPLPSVKGGAIETLTTHLLNMNEKYRQCEFLVVSPYDKLAKETSEIYSHAKFSFHRQSFFTRLYRFISICVSKVSFKLLRPKIPIVSQSYRILRKFNPDVIIVEGFCTQVYQLTKLNKPIILHVHTDVLNIDVPYCQEIVLLCSKVWAISEFIKKRIEDGSNIHGKVEVLKNAIDISMFRKRNCEFLRTQLGITANDKIAIFCGRVVPIKGVLEMLHAFKNSNQPDLSLVIVGGNNFADSSLSEYEKLVFDYVKDNNLKVFFTGYQPQEKLSDFYSIADFSICPSICNEAAGLVIIEARCIGLPVIASNLGGIPEYVNPPSTILVNYDINFEKSLSEAIDTLCDSSVLDVYKANAQEDLTDYSLDSYYNNFINLL